MFTGDSSADFLHAGLYRHGLSNQPTSRHRNDGLRLTGVYITAAVRCAPPANRPTPQEQATCLPYLVRELQLLSRWRVLLALGQIAFDACLKAAVALGEEVPSPRPRFRHGATVVMGRVILVASYHPSRQNTQTGRLTPAMLDTVIGHACRLAGISSSMHASPSRLQTGRGGA
jgi:uracil-DNA glycosylase